MRRLQRRVLVVKEPEPAVRPLAPKGRDHVALVSEAIATKGVPDASCPAQCAGFLENPAHGAAGEGGSNRNGVPKTRRPGTEDGTRRSSPSRRLAFPGSSFGAVTPEGSEASSRRPSKLASSCSAASSSSIALFSA